MYDGGDSEERDFGESTVQATGEGHDQTQGGAAQTRRRSAAHTHPAEIQEEKKKRHGAGGTLILVLLILLLLAGIAYVLLDSFYDKIPFLGAKVEQTLADAQELADQYDYDGAIAALQENKRYPSNSQLQEKAQEYEAAKASMLSEIDALIASAEEHVWEFDYQGGADILKVSPYYPHSKKLQSKAAEYEKAQRNRGEQEKETIEQAQRLADMYDYDGAIAVLTGMENYEENPVLQARTAKYEEQKAACVPIAPEEVTHIFYHSLVVDPSKAFVPGEEGYDGWQQWMTTISEFDKITQSMYDRGYVLVGIHDLITKTVDKDGKVTISPNQIMLPEGKKAYVLSLDDLSYYHTYDNHGVASKVVLDEEGKPTCEYIQDDGTVVRGDYDAVPRLDTFLEEHPDGCYRGARGIIALTGYDGILGYRTDGAYSAEHNTNTDVYYADELQLEWLDAHPDFDWEQECADAKAVADAMKADGWEFANHTWGHKHVGSAKYDELVRDTERWMQYVSPLVGETDAIIFAHGEDISPSGAYDSSNEKYKYFKSMGFDIFCNVDSRAYTTSVTSEYLHQGRRNLDGYRIYQDTVSKKPMATDLFDANEVLDPERPLPVPTLDGSNPLADADSSGEGDEADEDSGEEEDYDESAEGDEAYDDSGDYDESGEYDDSGEYVDFGEEGSYE